MSPTFYSPRQRALHAAVSKRSMATSQLESRSNRGRFILRVSPLFVTAGWRVEFER